MKSASARLRPDRSSPDRSQKAKTARAPAHTAGIEHFVARGSGAHIFLGELGKAGVPGLGHARKFQLVNAFSRMNFAQKAANG